jgi:hypothetical protein
MEKQTALPIIVVASLVAALLACSVGLPGPAPTQQPSLPPQPGQETPVAPTRPAPIATSSPPLPTRPAPRPTTFPTRPSPQGGTIAGQLSYPSEMIPELRVVAFDVNSMAPAAVVETAFNQSTYVLNVAPGTYHVVAYTMDGMLAGGYSQAVPCGLQYTCTDHSLIPVQVLSGGQITGIDPGDWYAPPGTFPPAP